MTALAGAERLEDLKSLVTSADRFLTVALAAASGRADARAHFEAEWKSARQRVSGDWAGDELTELDDVVADLHHGDGEAVVLVHARKGVTLVEWLQEPIIATTVSEGPLPTLATVIEGRQRVIAHVVVEADRAGADVTAFDGGTVLTTETIDGSTEHIHRGHFSGWSQRRFQQRAENTWERNANEVADAVAATARAVDARLVAVAGDVRAQTFVLESLPADVADKSVKIEAGSPAGIADEVVRLLSSIVAERVTELAARVRDRLPHGTASVDTDEVMAALGEGRVETLLVHDDGSGHAENPVDQVEPRLVDQAIAAALSTDAEIVVVPHLAMMNGPLMAVMRW